jgi:hypothetical protein
MNIIPNEVYILIFEYLDLNSLNNLLLTSIRYNNLSTFLIDKYKIHEIYSAYSIEDLFYITVNNHTYNLYLNKLFNIIDHSNFSINIEDFLFYERLKLSSSHINIIFDYLTTSLYYPGNIYHNILKKNKINEYHNYFIKHLTMKISDYIDIDENPFLCCKNNANVSINVNLFLYRNDHEDYVWPLGVENIIINCINNIKKNTNVIIIYNDDVDTIIDLHRIKCCVSNLVELIRTCNNVVEISSNGKYNDDLHYQKL